MKKATTKVIVKVYDGISIEVIINKKRDGYSFKTPKAFGGRHYYSFANHLDDAFDEQYPSLAEEINNNCRNN